jgi:hypothetical protein
MKNQNLKLNENAKNQHLNHSTHYEQRNEAQTMLSEPLIDYTTKRADLISRCFSRIRYCNNDPSGSWILQPAKRVLKVDEKQL